MFGSNSNAPAAKSESEAKTDPKSQSPESGSDSGSSTPVKTTNQAASGEKRSGNSSPQGRSDNGAVTEKKRRGSGVGGKASSLIASARQSLNFSQVGSRVASELSSQTPLQKLGKQDPALVVPQGQYNNSAGDSSPGPRSTFRVGVWEDRNRKCRRTMEDTHAFLYNFLSTPAPVTAAMADSKENENSEIVRSSADVAESDNGYFAIFDGHAGTFAADWCGKKLHIILEELIRKSPNTAIPELLDQTFTSVDTQLEKLPLKNSGCTAAVAVLRWEDRVPREKSATGSQAIAPAALAASKESETEEDVKGEKPVESIEEDATTPKQSSEAIHNKLKQTATRQRVLYTANVGDARIILCRSGKALRLSYDHKGSDENEGKRIANAGGLILNNRVNGVLAVTRALGDTYMKDLVTGHPFTTETVIQAEMDEFMIIACDGLWDVCSDQEAVDHVRKVMDPIRAAQMLVEYALGRFSTDNLSCMIVRLDKEALMKTQADKDLGVDGEQTPAKVSEVEKIVMETKQKIADGAVPAVGVSATNSGLGQLKPSTEQDSFVPMSAAGDASLGSKAEAGVVEGTEVPAGGKATRENNRKTGTES